MNGRRERGIGLGLLLLFTALTQLWWYLSTPLGQAPDEYCHADYVNHLVEYGELPCLGRTRVSVAVAEIRFQTSTGDRAHNHPVRIRETANEDLLWQLRRDAMRTPTQWSMSSTGAQPPLSYTIPAAGVTASEALTPREREVLQLLAEGKSNKDVAVALEISPKTVETHRARIFAKLHLHSMNELVRYAIRNQVIEP